MITAADGMPICDWIEIHASGRITIKTGKVELGTGLMTGQVVALSYPTWAPNFASAVSPSQNQWRASRKKDNCAPKKNTDASKRRFARNSHAHQKVGSTRSYDCNYTGGRLLYWAYFVPSKKK